MAYLVTVFAVYFTVSNRNIQVSAFIQSAESWEPNRDNALRAIFLNAPTGRTFNDGVVSVDFDGTMSTPEIPSHGHIQVATRPTVDQIGDKKLAISFTAPGEKPFQVQSTIKVAPRKTHTPKFTKRRIDNDAKQKHVSSWEGDIGLSLLPTGAELARGLDNTIYFATYDAKSKTPVATVIKITKVKGVLEGELKPEYTTDPAGVVVVKIRPMTTIRLTLEVSERGTERTGKGTINIFTVPSQFKIIPSDLIVWGGSSVEGSVQSLHRSGALFVDVYEHGVWRVADGFGIRRKDTGFRTNIAEVDAAYVKVQIYQSLFDADRAWDVSYYAIGDPTDCAGALKRIAAEVAKTKSDHAGWARVFPSSIAVATNTNVRRCRRWLHAMLLAIPPEFTKVPTLVNSQKQDREALEAWRADVQADLKIATGVALGAGLLVIFLIVLQGLARSREQERLFKEVDAELDDGEVLQIGAAEQYLVLMRVIILFVTLIMFAAAVMMLLNFL